MRPPAIDGERLVQVADWGQVALIGGQPGAPLSLVETLFVVEGTDPAEVLQLATRWQAQVGGPLLAPSVALLDGQGPSGRAAIRLQRPAPRGSTLLEVASGHGAMKETIVAALVVDILAALLACHRHGLVVGGLGPEHLFVCPPGLDGAAALSCHDPGLAALVACAGHPPPAMGSRAFEYLYGSAAVVAPELLEGRSPTAASDMYALCATMARLLRGRHVHDATEPRLLRHAALAGVSSEIAVQLQRAAPTLSAALIRGLSTAPLLRSGVGVELDAALQAVLGVEQRRRLMSTRGGEPWAIGSPLIPLAAYAGATSYADRLAATVAPAGPAGGPPQGGRPALSEGLRRARLEAALAELETRQALTDRRGAGRRVTVASLVIVLITTALCAIIVWVGMRRSRIFSGNEAGSVQQARPPPPLELPRRRLTPITPPVDR